MPEDYTDHTGPDLIVELRDHPDDAEALNSAVATMMERMVVRIDWLVEFNERLMRDHEILCTIVHDHPEIGWMCPECDAVSLDADEVCPSGHGRTDDA